MGSFSSKPEKQNSLLDPRFSSSGYNYQTFASSNVPSREIESFADMESPETSLRFNDDLGATSEQEIQKVAVASNEKNLEKVSEPEVYRKMDASLAVARDEIISRRMSYPVFNGLPSKSVSEAGKKNHSLASLTDDEKVELYFEMKSRIYRTKLLSLSGTQHLNDSFEIENDANTHANTSLSSSSESSTSDKCSENNLYPLYIDEVFAPASNSFCFHDKTYIDFGTSEAVITYVKSIFCRKLMSYFNIEDNNQEPITFATSVLDQEVDIMATLLKNVPHYIENVIDDVMDYLDELYKAASSFEACKRCIILPLSDSLIPGQVRNIFTAEIILQLANAPNKKAYIEGKMAEFCSKSLINEMTHPLNRREVVNITVPSCMRKYGPRYKESPVSKLLSTNSLTISEDLKAMDCELNHINTLALNSIIKEEAQWRCLIPDEMEVICKSADKVLEKIIKDSIMRVAKTVVHAKILISY